MSLNLFLNKILSNKNANTSADLSMSTRSRSHSRNVLASIPEDTVTDPESGVSMETYANSDEDVRDSSHIDQPASISTTSVKENAPCASSNFPETNKPPAPVPPEPVFAMPAARAPRSQSTTLMNTHKRFIDMITWFQRTHYLAEAEREYIISTTATFLVKKILGKYHCPGFVESAESKRPITEHMLQYLVNKGLMPPSRADMLMNSDSAFRNYEAGSIIDCSVVSRTPSVSGYSNASFQPYQPFAPRNMNFPIRNTHVPPVMSNPRWTGRSNESRFSSFEPVYSSQSTNSLSVLPVLSWPQENENNLNSVCMLKTKSNPLGTNSSDNYLPNYNAPTFKPLQNNTLSKPRTASKENSMPSSQCSVQRKTTTPHPVKETVTKPPSPVKKVNKRKREARHEQSKKSRPAALIKGGPPTKQLSQLDNSIANQSITRYGRISKPVTKYWDI